MDKYIVFLAAGKWQEPWVTYLKGKGHKILLVDPNENPVCRKHSDLYFRCDVKNSAAIKDYIEQNNILVEFFTTDQTDVSTIPVAWLSDYFRTPGNPLEVVKRFTNKYESREFVRANFGDDHIPAFQKVATAEEVVRFVEALEHRKAILKPADAQSSRGIFLVDGTSNPEFIEQAVEEALPFTQEDYLIIEEFVEGVEITVEGLMTPNGHKTLAGSRKKHFRTGIASELAYQLETDSGLWEAIIKFHDAVVDRTGLKMGITHTEYIIDEQRKTFHLVEMACRGGGSLIPSAIVPWVSGVNLYDVFYAQLTRQEITAEMLEEYPVKKGGSLHFFEFPSGKVESILGTELANELEGVLRMELEFNPGDTLHPATDDRGRQGFAIVLGENREQVNDTIKEIYELVSIEYQQENEPVTI